MGPEPEIFVVAEAPLTSYELPALTWLLPVALMAVLLVLRRRYPGLTPILIGVAAIPVAVLFLILMGQVALVVTD